MNNYFGNENLEEMMKIALKMTIRESIERQKAEENPLIDLGESPIDTDIEREASGMNMCDLTLNIKKWAKERGLDKADPDKQMLKLMEEAGELAEGIAKGKQDQIVDSIGDVYVVLVILSKQLGLDVRDCVQVAYDEIKDRTGEMKNGIYVKESDL